MAGLENRVISPEPDLGPRILFNERLWDVVWATQGRKTPLLCAKCLETPPATSLVEPLIRADLRPHSPGVTETRTWAEAPPTPAPFPHNHQENQVFLGC